jgi:FkbM family methyltransferase
MKYFACIIIRDGEKTIAKCISSILNQTIKPIKIVVVNDGSTDGTGTIIDKFKDEHPNLIEVINTDNKIRDYTRLPKLRTMAIEYAQTNGCRDCEYFMTTGGDCDFEPQYAEKILAAMEKDHKLVIASGDYGEMNQLTPHGAGRFIRASFFDDYRKNYPLRVCQESELKMRAIVGGYKVAVIDATFEHLDKLGHSHNFDGWGRNMKLMGYSRLFVLSRFSKDFFSSNIGKRSTLRMLWRYLTYRPEKEGYFSRCEPDLRKAIAKQQRDAVIKAIMSGGLKRRLVKILIPRKMEKRLFLPAKFRGRFRGSGIEGDLAYVDLDNGLRLYGYKSKRNAANFYSVFADRLPRMLTADTYGCAIDVAMRYLNELPYDKNLLPQRGGTIAEIGAYLGHKTIKFAELVGPEGRVLAVEMMPDNFAILERNIRENNITNVTLKHIGAWNERQTKQVVGASQQRNSLVELDDKDFLPRGVVHTDTLDNILGDWDVPTIDFLNIRVNGAEIEVLEGLNTQLSRVKVIFVASLYSREGERAITKVKEILKQKGCKIVIENRTQIYAVTEQYAQLKQYHNDHA